MKTRHKVVLLIAGLVMACSAVPATAQSERATKVKSPGDATDGAYEPPFVEVNHPVEEISQNREDSTWVNDERWQWSYDAVGRETNARAQDWDGSDWVDLWDISTAFDASGNAVETVVQERRSGTLQNARRGLFAYDDAGNRTEETWQNWSGAAADWNNAERTLSAYDDSGNRVERISQKWISAAWENESRWVTSYDESGNMTEQTEQDWKNSGWENDWRSLYAYDDSGNLAEEIYQTWVESAWKNQHRSERAYDYQGNLVEEEHQQWDGAAWINDFRSLWIFDDYGNMIEVQCNQQWTGTEWQNWGSGTWGCSGRLLYTYDVSGKPLVEQEQHWDGLGWADSGRRTYLYDDAGRLVEYSADDGRHLYRYETASTVSYATYVPPGWMLDWTVTEDGYGMSEIAFADANTGVVFVGGSDFSTTDGGQSWNEVNLSDYAVDDAFFLDATTGFAVGSTGALIRTTDGGERWIRLTSGTTADLNGVFFSDPATGTVVGGRGTILRTTDGGITWTTQASGTNEALMDVFFTDGSNGIVVGDEGAILRTTDGGESWHADSRGSGGDLRLWYVFFADADTGMIFGNGGEIMLRTSDGGESWTQEVLDLNRPVGAREDRWISAVHFIDANTGMAVEAAAWCGCVEGAILRTTDGGHTWERAQFSEVGFKDIHVVDANTAVAIGVDTAWAVPGHVRKGVILRLTIGESTAIEALPGPDGQEIPDQLVLHQNYPNPFNPTTTISYALPDAGDVRLTIFNALGQAIEVIGTGYQVPGTYSVQFDATDLPSGVYFYRLDSGGSMQTRAMLLSK